jgi:hypothetical protein
MTDALAARPEPAPASTRLARAWNDLTGRSPRWTRTLLYAVLASRLSMVLIGVVVVLLAGEGVEENFSGLVTEIDALSTFGIVIFAPVLESLMLLFVVWLLGRKLRWPVPFAAVAAGLLFVPLHGLSLASLTIGPFFALMAAIQLNWLARGRGHAGFWLVVLIHALSNSVAVVTVAAFPAH